MIFGRYPIVQYFLNDAPLFLASENNTSGQLTGLCCGIVVCSIVSECITPGSLWFCGRAEGAPRQDKNMILLGKHNAEYSNTHSAPHAAHEHQDIFIRVMHYTSTSQ